MKNIFDEMISDEAMLAAISEVGGKLYELPARLSAKLRSLVKRGILAGCTCGCRGDFKRTDP